MKTKNLSLALILALAALGAQAQHLPRNTYSATVGDLVARYNVMMGEIDRSLMLPPAQNLAAGARNGKFHVLEHKVSAQITVSFEVDNSTGKPFSINLRGLSTSSKDAGNLLAVMAAISATTFGRGSDAGAVARACTAAAKSKQSTNNLRLKDLDVYCTVLQGVWLAGVSVPASLPPSVKR